MSSKRMKRRHVWYAGRRMNDRGKFLDLFVTADDEAKELHYSAKRRCDWCIGNRYSVLLSDSGTLDFGSFEVEKAGKASDELIDAWSVQDASARRAKQNEGARKRLERERREQWMEALEPLRRQYRAMSFSQRRAMRQLIIEWLKS